MLVEQLGLFPIIGGLVVLLIALYPFLHGLCRYVFVDLFSGSPAVSVTGPRDLPDNPPTPPPVAGAAGETG